MFLQGFIDENLEPLVDNVFLVGREHPISLEAIVDTGFNGALCLPKALQTHCVLDELGIEDFELADGTVIQETLYMGQLLVNDIPYTVELLFTDTHRPLIGMQLLLDKVATFDLKNMRLEVVE